jgi:alpha-glucoside transport system permease protein
MRWLKRLPLHLFLILVMVVWIAPTVGLLITSFRPASEVNLTGWWTVLANPFQARFTLDNYIAVLTQHGLATSFRNSFFIAIPATLIPTLVAAFAAYAFAWMHFPGRYWLFLLTVALLVIPYQMTMIPILRIYNRVGLAGSFVGIWLAHAGYGLPFAVFLLRNFIGGLPRDILESAFIDGASHLTAFFRLVIPLSVPALASLVIFQFLWVWNDLLVALVYLGGSPSVAPLTVRLANMVGTFGQNWHLLTAAAFVSMVVPMIIFLSLQRYFVRGILAGAVKG